MAKFKNPTLFSTHFNLDATILKEAGLIDPFLEIDTQLFIDPVLLEKSSNLKISVDGYSAFRKHFENYLRLLQISKIPDDAAWKGARRLLDLREPPQNGLGYGGSSRSGSSRPELIQSAILKTSKEIVDLGADDPEMVSLMGFFEEDVGPDTISDFTTRVIMEQLAEITEEFCQKNKIPIQSVDYLGSRSLPHVQLSNGRQSPLVLVPEDIVRDLPIANDWSDIERAITQNGQIRAKVNSLLAGIAKPTVSDRKSALRQFALSSADALNLFLATVKEHNTSYDPNIDALGYYKFKSIVSQGIPNLNQGKTYDLKKGPEEVKTVVMDSIECFRHQVENGNLWEELWIGDKPKKERASQLFYSAVADAYCRAHNVDLSPEADMGGGPIDFKFSDGYKARVLVEMKRSSGTVVHGYETQLEIYKDSSETQFGVFVIMNYGGLGHKLRKIQKIRTERLSRGESASDIVVIDASKKASASRRVRK